MMTTESMLSKRPPLRFPVVLFILFKLFSFHIYCIPIHLYKIVNTGRLLIYWYARKCSTGALLSIFSHTSKIENIVITDEAYAGAYLGKALCHAPPPFDSAF